MLRNTTYSEIKNDIRGKGDWLLEEGEDDSLDYTRKIELNNVNVIMVRRSYEFFEPMYRNALIVVTQNLTETK